MTRFHATSNGNIPFTAQEEVDADTQEASWLAAAPERLKALTPKSVSMRQAELALLAADLLDDVEDLVSMLPRAAQIEWRRAGSVERQHPLIAVMQQATGMTDAQIDQLFIAASVL